MGTVESRLEPLFEHLEKGLGQPWEQRGRQFLAGGAGLRSFRPHLRADCYWGRISFWRFLFVEVFPCKPRVFWYGWATFFPSFVAPFCCAGPSVIASVLYRLSHCIDLFNCYTDWKCLSPTIFLEKKNELEMLKGELSESRQELQLAELVSLGQIQAVLMQWVNWCTETRDNFCQSIACFSI